MKRFRSLCGMVLAASLLLGMGGLAASGEKRIPDGRPAAVILDSLSRHFPSQMDNQWRKMEQDASWRVQYYPAFEYRDVGNGRIAAGGASGSLGVGRNDAGYIAFDTAKMTAASPAVMAVTMVPREKNTDGYERMALAYTVPEDGEYLITTDEQYSVVQMSYAVSHPEYYTPENGVAAEDKFTFAIYHNNTRIFPAQEEWLYLTPGKLSAELPTLTRDLKKGDVIRYVSYSGENTSGAWLNAMTFSPQIYRNSAPAVEDMSLICTAGKESAPTAFAVRDESGKALTFAVADAPAKGSVRITNAQEGLFVYTADPGTAGQTDAFTYTAQNALGRSVKATVRVNIVQNQPAYPTVTEFETIQDVPLENAALKVVDPDSSFAMDTTSEAVADLLLNGWELTGGALTDEGEFPAEKIGATFDEGSWTVAYKSVIADSWHPMDYVAQWKGGGFADYPGGEEVIYYSSVSDNIHYRVDNIDGKLYSWFKLQTVDGPAGDPSGSLVYTAAQDGTYRFYASEGCPDIGIPLIDWLDADGVNFTAEYWVEINGTEVEGSRYAFHKKALDMPFPEMTMDLKRGDTVRFVVSMGRSWAGWKQRFMMAPTVTRLDAETPLTVSIHEQPRNGRAEITDPIGRFRYVPREGFSGTDSFVVHIDDGQDVSAFTVRVVVHKDEKPTAENTGCAIDPGETAAVTLRGADDHGKALTFRITGEPQHGTARLQETDGAYQVVYTPNAGFTGYDTVAVVCNDGRNDSQPATVYIAVGAPAYDALETIRLQVSANAERTQGNTRIPYLIDNVNQYAWRAQYYYIGVTGNISLEKERVYMTAGAAIWQVVDGWEGMIINDNWRTCGGISTAITDGETESLSISSGYNPNSMEPVGALSFFAPEDGTYLLLPDELFPYFSPVGIGKSRLNRPVEMWIEKDGKQIWPAEGTVKVGAEDDPALMPPLLVALKKDAKVRFCVQGFMDENGDYMSADVRPAAYAVGAYEAALDPKPEGEADYIGGGGSEEPTPPTAGTTTTTTTAAPTTAAAAKTTAVPPTRPATPVQPEEPWVEPPQEPQEDPDAPVDGLYRALTEEVLRRQLLVAENATATVRLRGTAATLTPAMADQLIAAGCALQLEFCDEAGEILAIWNIPSFQDVTEPIVLDVSDSTPYEEQLAVLFEGFKRQNVILMHGGTLPAGSTLTLRNHGDFRTEERVVLYRLNPETNRLEKLEAPILFTSDASYMRFTLQAGGSYVLSTMDDKETIQITVPAPPAGGLPVYAIVLIVIGGVLLAGGAAVLVGLLIRRKRGRKQA